MLVLSRQKNQTIMIGDLIEISIVDIRGDKVRLGITAPVSIPVHRKEVYEAIRAENRQAAGVPLGDVAALEQIVRRPGSDEAAKPAPAADERPSPQASGAGRLQ
ncbi:MAG TPA: carbon storage regulator CsrA [Phycisphaerae bacterium]|nr:carbon storage regulator CsrA [Phycisphaerae bacterium]HOI54774.1 carbon storage regulator CsrA [Phycisphaerae bacterium]